MIKAFRFELFSRYNVLAVLVFILITPHLIQAQNDNTTLLGRWANGPSYTVKAIGSLVFVGNGGYLQIVDFSDPQYPIEIGRVILPSMPRDIIINSDYAFVATGESGLHIIDISDVENPFETGFFEVDGWTESVAVDGDYAYVLDGSTFSSEIKIVNISDVYNPIEVGTFQTGGSTKGIYILGEYAYVTDMFEGLYVIDISSPTEPIEVGNIEELANSNPYDVIVRGNYAYVAAFSRFFVIDVSDPSNPIQEGSIDIGPCQHARCVDLVGEYAYVANSSYGLYVIDISNPIDPTTVSLRSGNPHSISISGERAYIVEENYGISALDISNPQNLTISGQYYTGARSHQVIVKHPYAYVSQYNKLRILDISDPSNTLDLGSYDAGNQIRNVFINDSYAFITKSLNTLSIVDVSDPAVPVDIGSYVTNGHVKAVRGNFLYLTEGSGWFVLDISNPTAPSLVASIDMNATDLVISGSIAYVANGIAGLNIFDISDNLNIFEIGRFEDCGPVYGLTFLMSNVYLLEGIGIRSIDVSEPSNPFQLTFSDSWQSTISIDASDHYIYLAAMHRGLRIIQAESLTEVGHYETSTPIYGVDVEGAIAYTTSVYDGLHILQNDHQIDTQRMMIRIDSVNASPTDTVIIGVNVTTWNETTISSFELNIVGFSEGIEFVGIERQESLIEGNDWNVIVGGADTLSISAFTDSSNSMESGILIRLKFVVPDNALPGYIPISLENIAINGNDFEGILETGGVLIPFLDILGDVNLNGEVDTFDVSQILQYVVGTIQFTESQLLNANLSMDTTISALDAVFVLQKSYGLIDTLPIEATAPEYLAGGFLNENNFPEIHYGEPINLRLELLGTQNVLSLEGTIRYDPTMLTPRQNFFNCDQWFEENVTETSQEPGILKFAAAGLQAQGNVGIIAEIGFYPNHFYPDENTTEITLELIRFNENLFYEDLNYQLVWTSEIDQRLTHPETYALSQNYPNPFNPSTTIRYALPEQSTAKLTIYDILGKEVVVLQNELKPPGLYDVRWNGLDGYGKPVSTGVYICLLQAGSYVKSIKTVFLK